MRIRTAPHAGRPELARPKSLEFTYRNRAIGTGISVVPPIGAGSLGVSPVLYPRRCIGLSEPAARNKRKHDDANQSGGVAHSSLLLTVGWPTPPTTSLPSPAWPLARLGSRLVDEAMSGCLSRQPGDGIS